MDNNAKLEKYRGLSITALVTGLLSVIAIPQIFRWSYSFHVINLETLLIKIIIVFILGIGFPAAAIVCGSVDLKRIKAGRYSNKGKGFSITGIVLGTLDEVDQIMGTDGAFEFFIKAKEKGIGFNYAA